LLMALYSSPHIGMKGTKTPTNNEPAEAICARAKITRDVRDGAANESGGCGDCQASTKGWRRCLLAKSLSN
jgi:hypothetical protein